MSDFAGFRARIHGPGPLYSAMQIVPDAGVATILGRSGFDYVVLDAEHGPFTLPSIRECVEAIQAGGTAAVVRSGAGDPTEIKHLLDLGVDGILVPSVESGEDAAAAVRASRYPPEGIRGASPAVRAHRFGTGDVDLAATNASIAVLVVIESGRGVENAAAIAATPGLDGIFVGPYDLSVDLGSPGRPDDPTVQHAIDAIVDAALAAGTPIAANRGTAYAAERGLTLVHCFMDAPALVAAGRAALADARAAYSTGGSDSR
jgi:4-hydroxy-2-oxoheptanedioate aldolase